MSIDFTWVEQVLLGRGLSDREVTALREAMQVESAPEGTKIMEQGQTGGVLYILRSGRAEVQYDARDPIAVAIVGEGATLGEMSFLNQATASASVVARSECLIYRITHAAFTRLMSTHPELVFSVFAYLLRRTALVIRQMNDNHISMHQYISGGRMGV